MPLPAVRMFHGLSCVHKHCPLWPHGRGVEAHVLQVCRAAQTMRSETDAPAMMRCPEERWCMASKMCEKPPLVITQVGCRFATRADKTACRPLLQQLA